MNLCIALIMLSMCDEKLVLYGYRAFYRVSKLKARKFFSAQEAITGTALSSAGFFSSSMDCVACGALAVAAASTLFCARRYITVR